MANPYWAESPLFPTGSCDFPTKDSVVRAWQLIGDKYGSIGGKLTGHMARVFGARRMALANIELWRIQIFGRWGSTAVLTYIKEAPVAPQTRLAESIARGLDLAAVQEQAAMKIKGVTEAQVTELIHRGP